MTTNPTDQSLKDEIAHLRSQLSVLQSQLTSTSISTTQDPAHPTSTEKLTKPTPSTPTSKDFPSHSLLLLSDSALPLGSFAFSSGLESYLAHHRSNPKNPPSFPTFLTSSLLSLATTTLPYLIACHRNPSQLEELDDTLDASTLCPVARRASIAQGKALLTLWERAFVQEATDSAAKAALQQFLQRMKSPKSQGARDDWLADIHGHYAPLFAVVCAALSISLHASAYTYLLNHAKAVCSAAVRASVLGPYAAQGMLASSWLKMEIERIMEGCWEMEVEEAGQGVPMLDLWIGRHELLYSRIFNS